MARVYENPDPANVGRRGTRWRNAKREAWRIWGTDCWICGHPDAYEGDHVVRLADGGDPYDPWNIRPAHGSNYPCPVCTGARTGRPRCCNQERNGHLPQRVITGEVAVDLSTI